MTASSYTAWTLIHSDSVTSQFDLALAMEEMFRHQGDEYGAGPFLIPVVAEEQSKKQL